MMDSYDNDTLLLMLDDDLFVKEDDEECIEHTILTRQLDMSVTAQ